jgi:hypothetical protein
MFEVRGHSGPIVQNKANSLRTDWKRRYLPGLEAVVLSAAILRNEPNFCRMGRNGRGPATPPKSPEPSMQNKANCQRDRGSGIRGQRPNTRFPPPDPRTFVRNKANFHQGDMENKCFMEKGL